MRFAETELDGVVEVTIERHTDERGWFARTWCVEDFADVGLDLVWMQVNQGFSPSALTLRGLHLQGRPHAEVKYVRCISGRVFDVAADVRPESPTYGSWAARELSAERGNGLIVPEGFAHGYLTLEPDSAIMYWTSHRYEPDSATGVRYDDPVLGIEWPADPAIVSVSDLHWAPLRGRTDL